MAYFTAQAIARKVKENLDLSMIGDTYVESLDSNGFPMLKIVKAGEAAFLKVEMIEASGHVDGLGLPQRQYSPHKMTVIFDDAAVQKELVYKLTAKATAMGMKVVIMEGTGVGAALDYAAALALSTVKAEIRSHEIHAMTLSV